MSLNSSIEWCHHTFNIWWGCEKISPACKNCYAAFDANRFHKELRLWGPRSVRKICSKGYWKNLDRYQKIADKTGHKQRVFVNSMSDFFDDHPQVRTARMRYCTQITRGDHPGLIHLLLTKRPENIKKLIPISWFDRWPDNVWLGVTAENDKYAHQRIPYLLDTPAPVKFLSCEPLLGQLSINRFLGKDKINWMILGGESGFGSRRLEMGLVNRLKGQAEAYNVPLFIKQFGQVLAKESGYAHKKGGDPGEWPAEFRVRQLPECA